MPQLPFFAFNRGLVDRRGLARAIDVQRIAFSAETMTNYTPRVLGSMMMRPGLEYVGTTESNQQARLIPFVFATDDVAILEFTNNQMRVWVSDAVITRPSVSTSITNGGFNTDLTGWTDSDESGATSQQETVGGVGVMSLAGDGTNRAIRDQQVTVAVLDQNVQHALEIDIERGPVTLRVGSTQGDDDYLAEVDLRTGVHSLTFTPTGDFWIRLMAPYLRKTMVDSISIASSGDMVLTTTYATADLSALRYDQSGDVVFIACDGQIQRRVERRSNNSWSYVNYEPPDGPFRTLNVSATTLTPSALTGNVTLTASVETFTTNNVGSLYKIDSQGQNVTASIAAENTFTNSIKVTGVTDDRIFGVTITGTFVATVTLQRSTDNSTWVDTASTWTAPVSTSYDDGLDNQIVYYRIGVKTGDYTSGTATCTLDYDLGSITGVARVTGFTSATVVDAEVLSAFGATDASADWYEGEWSDRRGFPTSLIFHEGRLWHFGQNGIWGSISDAFDSFDDAIEGDSGPLNRTIGSGPVDKIYWGLSLGRLMIGAQGGEWTVKSTSLDEPLTPTNFNLRETGSQGSANVPAVKIDSEGLFVQRGGYRVFGLQIAQDVYDYVPRDLSSLVPDIGNPGFIHMAVQMQPDRRVHCVRSDGTVAMLVIDKNEQVACWLNVESDGASGQIEDVISLPAASGDADDQVYYVVQRTVNGSTVRHIEKLAQEADCVGGTLNKCADSFLEFTNSPASATVTGLDHLEGEAVVVWADGLALKDGNGDVAEFTVSSGSITLTNDGASYTATTGIVGLAYTAQWESGKLIQVNLQIGNIGTKKLIKTIALMLADTHHKGLQYGPDFSNLQDLPQVIDGAVVSDNTVHADVEIDATAFPGQWTPDARLCLQSAAPRPCTVLGAMVDVESK